MLTGTRTQVSVVLLILLFVAGASAGATFINTRNHEKDHLATDIINHQLHLTGEIALLVLSNSTESLVSQPIDQFENNMSALRSGGAAVLANGDIVDIVVQTDPAVIEKLNEVPALWLAFRDDALEVLELSPDHSERAAAIARLQANMAPLIAVLDRLVDSHDAHMESDLSRLRSWQTILLLSAVALLMYVVILVRRRVIRVGDIMFEFGVNQPDQRFDSLDQEVYSDEVASLVASFERMRPVISAAQQSLESEVLRRTRQLMTAFEYSQEIVSHVDKNSILRQTLASTQNLVSAQSIALCLIEADGSLLELSAVRGEIEANIAQPLSNSVGQPIQIIPIEPSASLADLCSECYFAEVCRDDIALAVPLQADARQIGSLCVVRDPEYPLDEDERQALQLIANSAAIAISNYRLADTSRFKDRQEAIIAERERLTAVLHDNLAQTLGYLNLKADRVLQMASDSQSELVLDELTSIKSATGSAYDSVREMLASLSRGSEARDIAASDNITTFVIDYRQVTGLDVSLEVEDKALTRLSPIAQQQAYYIIRESLTNIARHAEASAVTIQVFGHEDGIQVVVQDNGRGFDQRKQQEGTHLGLTIMQARARRCGGTLVIDSRLREGTLISAFLPNEEAETIYAN